MQCKLISVESLGPHGSLSSDISSFTFENLEGVFENLEAGAHIDVHLEDDLVRQYSLWKWSDDQKTCSVAVKREDSGRGGSLKMHQLKEGVVLEIGGPRNNFKLEETDCHYTLIAGGIGVTPIFAMANRLKELNSNFRVYYLVQTIEMAAFNQAFESLELGDNYHLHRDDIDGRLDLSQILSQIPAKGEVYACGPEPMLEALLSSSAEMRSGSIHFERFSSTDEIPHNPNKTFEIEIQSTGETYSVGEEDTILGVLQKNNVAIDSGCTQGLCGACVVDVLEGEVDHRDSVLTPEEQDHNDFMYVCVSRAKSGRLVLDL